MKTLLLQNYLDISVLKTCKRSVPPPCKVEGFVKVKKLHKAASEDKLGTTVLTCEKLFSKRS